MSLFSSSPDRAETRAISVKKSRSMKANVIKDNFELSLLTLPAVVFLFIWSYLPMVGTILAFKNYNYTDGIFGSPWAGFDNFKFFFASQDAWRITRNTVAYSVVFILVDTVFAVAAALLLFELKSRRLVKAYQTAMILPRFLSWVIVGYISYAFLNPSIGFLNGVLKGMGTEPVSWYAEPLYWPFILVFMNIWKGIGMGLIMYYAFLVGVDRELYEAATIDGANRWQQARYISIPSIMPLISILLIMSTGRVFRGDFGLFYQIPRDVGVLYPVTDVIDTYLYRGLKAGDFAVTTAIGLFQSAIGLILVVGSNLFVRRIDPEKSMF